MIICHIKSAVHVELFNVNMWSGAIVFFNFTCVICNNAVTTQPFLTMANNNLVDWSQNILMSDFVTGRLIT